MEIWRDIPGFEGVYQISNHGRLKSFKVRVSGYVLSTKNQNGDYLSVILCARGKVRHTRIHRLVAEAFIPNLFHWPEVNHRDGNKQNNHAWNLEWITREGNHAQAVKMNPKMLAGMLYYNTIARPKRVMQCDMNGKRLAEFPNAKEAERATGVCYRNILQVAAGTEYKSGKIRRQAGGYLWVFKEEMKCVI